MLALASSDATDVLVIVLVVLAILVAIKFLLNR